MMNMETLVANIENTKSYSYFKNKLLTVLLIFSAGFLMNTIISYHLMINYSVLVYGFTSLLLYSLLLLVVVIELKKVLKQIKHSNQSFEHLKEQNMLQKEQNATKDKFISIIAHDLKSPFNGIIGLSALLIEKSSEQPQCEEQTKFLKLINDSAKNTFKLLENLLEWARSQTGKIEYKPEKIDVGEIIKAQENFFRTCVSAKNIKINHEYFGNNQSFADKNMLNTVMRNLLSNAIKFSNSGDTINIITKDYNDYAEISISDQGVGMTQECMNKLFKPDVLYTSLGTENEVGTGLGLILCKELVEKNHGQIWVESQLTKGSTFRFTIPKYQIIEEKKKLDPTKILTHNHNPIFQPLEHKKLLVA